MAEDLDLTGFEGYVALAVRARATDIHLEPLPDHSGSGPYRGAL